MPIWIFIDHGKKKLANKGGGRPPARNGKTKEQARAEVIAKRAGRKNE